VVDLVLVETEVVPHPMTLGSIRSVLASVTQIFFVMPDSGITKKMLRLMRAACSEAYRLREHYDTVLVLLTLSDLLQATSVCGLKLLVHCVRGRSEL
jgi:hypothetical protein